MIQTPLDNRIDQFIEHRTQGDLVPDMIKEEMKNMLVAYEGFETKEDKDKSEYMLKFSTD